MHLRNIKFSSNVSDILALLGLRINPLLEKMRSTCAELAGEHKLDVENNVTQSNATQFYERMLMPL